MSRRPLFKSPAPPLSVEERGLLVQQARRALAERPDLPRAHRARGLLALHKAAERLSQSLSPPEARPNESHAEPRSTRRGNRRGGRPG